MPKQCVYHETGVAWVYGRHPWTFLSKRKYKTIDVLVAKECKIVNTSDSGNSVERLTLSLRDISSSVRL